MNEVSRISCNSSNEIIDTLMFIINNVWASLHKTEEILGCFYVNIFGNVIKNEQNNNRIQNSKEQRKCSNYELL